MFKEQRMNKKKKKRTERKNRKKYLVDVSLILGGHVNIIR